MRVFAISLGGLVFLTDLVTKYIVEKTIWLHYYPVIDGILRIQYVRNRGIAFGLFNNTEHDWKPLILAAVAVIAFGMVVYYLFTVNRQDRVTLLALGFLMGGILGNFADRVINQYVVDFVTLHLWDHFTWPTFNVADMAITAGVGLMLYRTLFESDGVSSVPLVLPLAFLVTPQPLPGNEIVARLQQKYEQIESFRAHFEQTFRSRGITQVEKGVVMMKRPGRMFWEYQDPAPKYFVADGKKTYFYVPAEKQVLVSDLDLSKADSPLLFLLGRGEIDHDFFVSREQPDEDPSGDTSAAPGVLCLRLTPKLPQSDFSYVLLEVGAQDFLIRKLTVVEPIGQENEYLLTDFEQNVRIPDQQFRLKIPSNVEVVEQ